MLRSTRAQICLLTALLVIGSKLADRTAAGPFTNLVVFGDSLSDVGNISQATPFLIVPKTPGPYYWNGRFSNGPVYAETLATGLGLPALVNSASGGNDFAYGGAQTTGTDFPTNLVVKDINKQVDQYTSSHNATASTLYVLFAGANDLINDADKLLSGQMTVSVPVGSLQTSLGKLYNDGARQFLVINLPPLGFTPKFNGNGSSITTYNGLSQQYNTALASMLTTFQGVHPTIALNQLDVYSLMSDARANPALYGLTNVASSAAPGLSSGATSYDTSRIAPNPNQYLFWDDLHPTANVHLILGHRALDLFFPPGDYNRNVVSDAGDYVTLRKGLGTTYQPIDYNIWRAHFGQTTAGENGGGLEISGGSNVPEPTSAMMALVVVGWVAAGLRARRRF